VSDALVVRNQAPGLIRNLLGAFAGSLMGLEQRAGPSMSDFSPFSQNAGWSIVSGQSPTSYERVGRNIRTQGFEKNAVVSACIRTIVDLIGPVRIELYAGEDGAEKTQPKNPGQLVLDTPRVGWSAARLRKMTVAHYVAYGNAFWVLERGGKVREIGDPMSGQGLPTGIYPLHPERLMYVYLDANTLEPFQYSWTDRVGRRHESSWKDVVHFRDLTLDADMIFGFPRAAAALLDIVTDGEASEYVRQIMGNNGAPGLLISVKGVKTEAQARSADERWNELQVKRGMRGNTRFMPDVEAVHVIGFNLRDLEFPDLRGIAREDICAALGVDPRMVGVASAKGNEAGLSGVQYAESRRRLYLQTGAPLMVDIESELDLNFCPEFGKVQARFSPDDLSEITEDNEETSLRMDREWQSGMRSREEARKVVKLTEVMKLTDHLTVPRGTSVFTAKDADESAAAAAQAVIHPPAPPPAIPPPPSGSTIPGAGASGNPPPGGEPAPAKKTRVPHPRMVQRSIALSEEQRRALWQNFDQRATKEGAQYHRTAAALFSTERDQVRSLIDRHARSNRAGEELPATEEQVQAVSYAIEQMFGGRGSVYEAWVTRYLQLMHATMTSGAQDIHASVGTKHEENARMERAVASRADRLASYVTKTTADQITAAVSAGHKAGLGISKIADLVDSSVFQNQAPARAMTIARTESHGTLNQGEFLAAQATGVIRSKAWLETYNAEVPREDHIACADEGFIGIEEEFSNGLMFPGDPDGDAEDLINCHCAQLFSDEEPK